MVPSLPHGHKSNWLAVARIGNQLDVRDFAFHAIRKDEL